MIFVSLLLSTICFRNTNAQDPSTVSIAAGGITGTKCPTTNVNAFLGIPFAIPPVGDLRFAPPIPLANFPNGSINAVTLPPSCIQFGDEFVFDGPESEDCLYMNIWTPANATGATLPVKVWIYGGADYAGTISDPLYNGCNLGTDAVVVSIAYRVGALGFLFLESAGIGGNFATQDLLLGLQWVQDNIVAFGGDPKQVLVFGQSAGAGLTWLLSTLPQAPSLMSAAIAESGAGRILPTASEYQPYGVIYANDLGCNTSDIACFRLKTPEQLNNSAPVLPATTIVTFDRFSAFVDGKVLPDQPLAVGSRVPFLAGSNTMEGTLFAIGQYPQPEDTTTADYNNYLQSNFGPLASTVSHYYSISAFNTTPFPAWEAIVTIITDSAYKCPTRRALEASAKAGVPVYTYLSSHVDTCGWEPDIPSQYQLLQLLGATHTSEIPLVFRQQTNLPLPNGTCSLDTQEVQISEVLTSAWSSMAIDGTPGAEGGVTGGPWPAYNSTLSLGLLISNSTSVGVVNYSLCDFWDQIQAAEMNIEATSNSSTASNSSSSTGTSTTSGSPATGTTNDGREMASSAVLQMALITALVFGVSHLAM